MRDNENGKHGKHRKHGRDGRHRKDRRDGKEREIYIYIFKYGHNMIDIVVRSWV